MLFGYYGLIPRWSAAKRAGRSISSKSELEVLKTLYEHGLTMAAERASEEIAALDLELRIKGSRSRLEAGMGNAPTADATVQI